MKNSLIKFSVIFDWYHQQLVQVIWPANKGMFLGTTATRIIPLQLNRRPLCFSSSLTRFSKYRKDNRNASSNLWTNGKVSPKRIVMVEKMRMSSISRGQDLLGESLAFGAQQKIILDSHGPTGVDVVGMVEYPNPVEEGKEGEERPKILHMNGSVIALPHATFLWKVSEPKDVTLESLSLVLLHTPPVEYLFIGSDKSLPPRVLNKVKKEFKKNDIVVEVMDVTTAMGTFNVLNGEDRRVSVALVIDTITEE